VGGRTLRNSVFSSLSVSQYHPKLVVVPVGMNSVSTTPLTSQKTVSMTLPADTSVLKFFSAGDPL
jgi:hypothetical protein